MATILLTGAAGYIGRILRERLTGHDVRCTDLYPIEGVEPLDVTDQDAVETACQGVDAVVHLGGVSAEAPFEAVLDANVRGTHHVLEGARRAEVSRVVLASSNHTVGFHSRGAGDLPDSVPPAPDTYYGWSKAAMKSLGALYHHRFGLHVVCLRIGTCADRPADPRALWSWLSPDDCARLVEASLTADGFHLVWGVSANTRRWWSAEGGHRIGYVPRDDAERYAAEVGEPEMPADTRVGGRFCVVPLGEAEVP